VLLLYCLLLQMMKGALAIDKALHAARLVHNAIAEDVMLIRKISEDEFQLHLGGFDHSSWYPSVLQRTPCIMDSAGQSVPGGAQTVVRSI
jgi:hypothetical protein